MKKILILIMLLSVAAAAICGCGGPGNTLHKDGPQSLEETPDLSYEVPGEQLPKIMTDVSGYETKNRKLAIFQGKNLPDRFDVVRADTGEVVYTAELGEKEYSTNKDEYNSYGDFSRLRTPGEYYIRCDKLGMSYSFVIQDDLYQTSFEETFARLSDGEERKETDAEELCNTAAIMLLSFELYPQVYEDGIRYEPNEIPDVLDEVALMIAQLSEKQDTQSGRVENITDCYAGVLAKFSYLYQKYDSVYATECLKAADLAWQYTVSTKAEDSVESHFFAAAELYRATGQDKYHMEAKTCAAKLLKKGALANDHALYGAVTYLATKRKVDVDLCTELMKSIMSEAEEIINSAKASFYLAADEQGEVQKILFDMMLLSVADYISTNQEYAVIIENQYHYLHGRNPWSKNLLNEGTLQDKGYLLMTLSQMLQADLEYEES